MRITLLIVTLAYIVICSSDMPLMVCAGQQDVELDHTVYMTEGRPYLAEGCSDYSLPPL